MKIFFNILAFFCVLQILGGFFMATSKKHTNLSEEMCEIARNYFAAERMLRTHVFGFSSGTNEEINAFKNYVKRVRDTYDSLEDIDKEIINNDFFFEDYPHWWEQRYSKSLYYRRKRMAMERFLKLFNE